MSRDKKPNKVLVRNSSVASRPRKSVEKANNPKKVHFSEDVSETPPTFTAPEFCTLLQLADEMKMVKKIQGAACNPPQLAKSSSLNFSPEEKIFQDLVGLDVPEGAAVNEIRVVPCPRLRKDPEIDFNKYTKYDLQPEYFFTSHSTPVVKKLKNVFEGYSIYQNLLMWADDE